MKQLRRIVVQLSIACVATIASASAQCREWADGFAMPGTNGVVRALAVFDDGSGPALFAAGDFTGAGGANAKYVAKWDGTRWSALEGGLSGGPTPYGHALAVFDDGSGPALYVGGSFTIADDVPANRIAKWDGTSWNALGSGTDAAVVSLTVFDDGSGPALFAGGSFTMAGGTGANHVAKWNGSTWSSVGTGTDDVVYALSTFDDGSGVALYAGGQFINAGGASANRVARWDGSTWTALAGGTNDVVYALSAHDDGTGVALYAGGLFTDADGARASHVARWDGSSWSALGAGTSETVRALLDFDDGSGSALYAGGFFNAAGGTSAKKVAKWDGTDWSALGTGLGDTVLALTAFDGALCAGGFFDDARPKFVARWDGAAWRQFGNGLELFGQSLAVFDDGSGPGLYVGSTGDGHAGAPDKHIARWDGSTWEPLGTGLNNAVHALTVYDDGSGPALIAGGSFNLAGGMSANFIARWDGSTWSNLGGGTNERVVALTVYDDGGGPALFAGGAFTLAGGVLVNCVAKWDGSTWSALGTGVAIGGGDSPSVSALTVFDDGTGPGLYVCGHFGNGSGVSARNVARWDGSTWSPLGSGVNGTDAFATSMAVFDAGAGAELYVGGRFGLAGGMPVSSIARWNGSSWNSAGSGVGGPVPWVYALTAFDDGAGAALYAGGPFTIAGGVAANRIAKWDGSAWTALDVGLSIGGGVYSLCAFDDGADGAPDLYVGGGFSGAGGKSSHGIAEWYGCEPGSAYCFGDGLDPVQTVECPCGNIGEPGHGCLGFPPSLGGARLFAQGSVNPNTIVLRCEDVANNTLCTFIRSFSNNATGFVFGDGVRCVNAPLFRFGQQMSGQMGNAPFTVAVPVPSEIPGSTVRYLVQYRNPNAGWCTPALFNASNGYTISW